MSQDKTEVERSTYSSLDWLGDIGGLFDALKLIAQYFVLPFSAFALKLEIFGQVFISASKDTIEASCCRVRADKRLRKMLNRAEK